jgi:hypothetical protein
MTKRLSIVVMSLAMLIALTGIVTAVQMCPWGDDTSTLPSGLPFNMQLSNGGLCTGFITASENYAYGQKDNISGFAGYTDGTMGMGIIEYAKETTIAAPTPTITTQKGITFSGARLVQSEAYSSIFGGSDNSTKPFCEGIMDSSGSDISSGQTASILNVNNAGAGIVLDYTSAVTGSPDAIGDAWSRTALYQYQTNTTHQYSNSISYSGKITVAHNFRYVS